MGMRTSAVGIFAIAFLLMVARRPDILLDAKLWAEDGQVWLTQAYASGGAALFLPHTGYLQTFSRIVFGFSAAALPLEIIPLFANIVGLVVRCAIVAFLCSRRFQFLGQVRFAIALFSIVMPGLGEVHANITNTHWYLGLYLLLLALAPYPTGLRQKLTDGLAIALCGISGPFALFALPAFGLRDLAHRRVHFTTLIAIACAGLQLVLIALTSSSRSLAPLGAT